MRVIKWLAAIGLLLAGSTALAFNSTNYRIDESFIGGGGLTTESSTNFQASESIGDVAVPGSSGDNSSSTNFQLTPGYTTTNDPALTFIVNTSTINFGALSTSSTATATSTFSVINYTSFGYIVQTLGAPPHSGSYTLAGMSSQTASATGTEQYGINLKANTSPTSFGANPSGGFGVAETGYSTANNYKYVSGDTSASAPKTSAQTNFTISYIVNASTTTAGGSYTGSQTLICTGTY